MPLEYWHMLTTYSARELDDISGTAQGIALLSDGWPLGFGGVFFQKNEQGDDIAVLFFYGGPNQVFVKKYIKLALRGMQMVFQKLLDMGVLHVYAVADKRVPRSETLARWLGGTPVGVSQDEGELYVIPLADTPLTRQRD